mgnify:CR=1 FL=1|tara:strand:+ start:2794 stop:4173 length:1380 start_codon:yes stop_codon:yes gene_type:complete
MAVPFSDLQQIAPSAVIELFQLELNTAQHGVSETYYFHAGTNTANNGNVVWNGQAYLAFPIEATDFEYTGTGSLPRPKLRISNIFGTITGLILSLPNGIEGAKVTRIRTLARYLDAINFPGGTNPTADPTAEFPREIYYIDRKAGENRDAIEFELAAAFDLVGVRAPKRQCVSNVCQWIYRGPECGYVGNAYFNFNDAVVGALSQDVCGKRLRSCELRFSQQRFGGTVTTGSNIITLDQAVSLSVGDPVTGFGIPASTAVSSVNSNLVTVSQNATASTLATSAGTISNDGTQIALSSAAGIIPGMSVTGSYLPANSQVTAVSGNTVTLSSPVPLEQFFTAIASTSASASGDRLSVLFPAGSSAAIGQFIASSTLPLARRALITNTRLIRLVVGKNLIQYKALDITQAAASSDFVLWTTYTGGTIPSATYTFTATNRAYTFRVNSNLPYGSFPGVGTYFT